MGTFGMGSILDFLGFFRHEKMSGKLPGFVPNFDTSLFLFPDEILTFKNSKFNQNKNIEADSNFIKSNLVILDVNGFILNLQDGGSLVESLPVMTHNSQATNGRRIGYVFDIKFKRVYDNSEFVKRCYLECNV